jgi:adenosylcobinamide-GDP ribazoletransferase
VTIPEEDSSSGSARGGVFLHFRLALSFLTIIPVPIDSAHESDVAASMAWFPLIGFLIGSALAIEDRALTWVFGYAIRSALLVLSMAMLTGAVHLDGLADTADALGAGRDRARALEILRDTRIGAFGAVALFFALALKVISLAGVSGGHRLAMLILAPLLARWAMVAVSFKIDYLRSTGAGSSMLGRDSGRNFVIASIIAILPMIPLFSYNVIKAYGTAIIATFMLRWFYRRWLGGITGDLIGACDEIVEVLVMLVMAAR